MKTNRVAENFEKKKKIENINKNTFEVNFLIEK